MVFSVSPYCNSSLERETVTVGGIFLIVTVNVPNSGQFIPVFILACQRAGKGYLYVFSRKSCCSCSLVCVEQAYIISDAVVFLYAVCDAKTSDGYVCCAVIVSVYSVSVCRKCKLFLGQGYRNFNLRSIQ